MTEQAPPERVWIGYDHIVVYAPPSDEARVGDLGEYLSRSHHDALMAEKDAEIERLCELLNKAGAFVAVHAGRWARDRGFPDGSFHPQHYDLIAECGCRMDAFTRADLE